MFLIYQIIISFVIIASPIIILIRLIKGKEDPNRFLEKFFLVKKKRPKGNLIWFHAMIFIFSVPLRIHVS